MKICVFLYFNSSLFVHSREPPLAVPIKVLTNLVTFFNESSPNKLNKFGILIKCIKKLVNNIKFKTINIIKALNFVIRRFSNEKKCRCFLKNIGNRNKDNLDIFRSSIFFSCILYFYLYTIQMMALDIKQNPAIINSQVQTISLKF